MNKRTDIAIIGGGQAGLATSACLAARRIDHVIFERGRVAERWRSERWDSLRLLTPSWQSRLPGWRYRGDDPDGFMTMAEIRGYLTGYAASLRAPIQEHAAVLALEAGGPGYRITTEAGTWEAREVVIATGACDEPAVPGFAAALPRSITQLAPSHYRRPDDLGDRAVLVVGASASGVQLADEIHRSGRAVTLAVGRHTRLPRTYRGRDIMWWLESTGVLSRRAEEVADLERSRRQPSLQLVGRPDHRDLDLPALAAAGVRLVGRAVGTDGRRIGIAADLPVTAAAADARLARLLARIDAAADRRGLPAGERPAPFLPNTFGPESIDLAGEGFGAVVWATGFRRRYPWLRVPVLDRRGEIVHRGGVTAAPGLYVLGLPFLRRRNSTFIDGVGRDAADIAAIIAARLEGADAAAA